MLEFQWESLDAAISKTSEISDLTKLAVSLSLHVRGNKKLRGVRMPNRASRKSEFFPARAWLRHPEIPFPSTKIDLMDDIARMHGIAAFETLIFDDSHIPSYYKLDWMRRMNGRSAQNHHDRASSPTKWSNCLPRCPFNFPFLNESVRDKTKRDKN